ncbi:MAG: DNA polymerase beta domain-containing [Geobacteraceae bacterium]|nr:MAG: DNA polymerase beta domain-containing [Geobacteraceae bacterium]
MSTTGVTTKEQIAEFIRNHREEFLLKYGVRRIGLFGSIVRDELTESSDIDIAIEMEPGKKNIHNFLAFKRYLENEFGRPVDLGIESTLKPLVREMINREIMYV